MHRAKLSLGVKAESVGTSWPKASGAFLAPDPAHPQQLPGRCRRSLADASSPPAAASGFFVYIRARWPTLRWHVCHRLAIICTHACGSAGSSGRRRRLSLLFACAASSPSSSAPSLPSCTYFIWSLAQGGRCSPLFPASRSRFALLSTGEWNYLFIYGP